MLILFLFFFYNDTSTPEIYTLSLHDALPIFDRHADNAVRLIDPTIRIEELVLSCSVGLPIQFRFHLRSEEHTSELQSRRDLVCRLLLEKKKNKNMKLCHYIH